MNIVMIAVHKAGNKIIGFRMLDTDSRDIKDVSYDIVRKVLKDKKADIENIKLEGNTILGSNGKLQRYPVLVNGQLYGRSPLVILFELPNNCYRVTDYSGEIVDMTEDEIIRYGETEGIANGKIVRTEDGKKYISSINGVYKQDKLLISKQYKEKLALKMKLIGFKDYEVTEDGIARVLKRDIEVLNLKDGVVSIADNGFKGCSKLREVVLPKTLERLGKNSFMSCVSLEKIEIPEGIVEIPERCFAKCIKLKEVYLPNSLRVIKSHAFFQCRSLTKVYCGRAPINIAYGAIPSRVKIIKR